MGKKHRITSYGSHLHIKHLKNRLNKQNSRTAVHNDLGFSSMTSPTFHHEENHYCHLLFPLLPSGRGVVQSRSLTSNHKPNRGNTEVGSSPDTRSCRRWLIVWQKYKTIPPPLLYLMTIKHTARPNAHTM